MRIRLVSFAAALTLLAAGLAAAPVIATPSPAAAAPGETRVTNWGDAIAFQFSPNGSRALIQRPGAEAPPGSGWMYLADLWEVTLAGGAPTRLVTGIAATSAAYAPSGDAIAFLRPDAGGAWRLAIYQSGQQRDLGAADPAAPPQWSADGQRLTLQRAGKIIAVNRQGVALTGVATLEPGTSGRLSPDGARRARVTWADVTSELWLDRADGTAPRLLLRGELELMGAPAWSPDGATLALTRTPNGSETADYTEVWLVQADGTGARQLTRNQTEEQQPAFLPDGQRLGFLRSGDLWTRGLSPDPLPASKPAPAVDKSKLTSPPSLESLLAPRVVGGAVPQVSGALVPPYGIRVMHTSANEVYCPWQTAAKPAIGAITMYVFEDYLKWVVPGEVSAYQWPAEAIKAQAVAARTYAWRKILDSSGWRSFDVYDSTADQFMCPDKLNTITPAETKAAFIATVNATSGQYASFGGQVILAQYSAENGDPTRSATPEGSVPYLIGVDDPVGFGQSQYGHGKGMSQWGAHRWVDLFGWNYQQILTHYYTGITVQLPGAASDLVKPLAGVLAPWPGWYLNSNRAALAANASDDYSGVASIAYTARYFNGSSTVAQTVTSPWNLGAVPDQAGIQITATVRDVSGKVGTGVATWGLDRAAPTGWVSAPATSRSSAVTLMLDASDVGPSGLDGMVFSRPAWTWEAEGGAFGLTGGAVVSDPAALNGSAWKGTKGSPARLFGPFATLPDGAYRAWFRLRAADVLTTDEVAFLEIIDNGDCYDPNETTCTNNAFKRIGMKRIRGVDFRAASEYQEFYVDFNVSGLFGSLEFPLWFRATSDLWFDRVMVTTFPTSLQASVTWTMDPGEGRRSVTVRYVDHAGNISPDYTVTTTVDSGLPSFLTADSFPWYRTASPTISVTVQDMGKGLNLSSGQYRYSTDGGVTWNSQGWLPAAAVTQAGWTTATLTATAVPFGQDSASANRLEFRIANLVGGQNVAGYTIPIDAVAPTALATAPAVTAGREVTVTWSAGDTASGVSSIDVQTRVGNGGWLNWRTTTTGASQVYYASVGEPAYFRARATDVAGNVGAYRDGNGDAVTAVGGAVASTSLPTGWSLLAVPLRPVVTTTAQSLVQSLGAVEVARWQAGSWTSHVAGLPTDFVLQPGLGYFVRLPSPTVWQTIGFTVTAGLSVPLSAGWNLVSAPRGTGPFTAATLMQSIAASGAGPRFVLRWRAGAWGMYGAGLGGTPFAIDPAAAYFVFCDAPGVWQP